MKTFAKVSINVDITIFLVSPIGRMRQVKCEVVVWYLSQWIQVGHMSKEKYIKYNMKRK